MGDTTLAIDLGGTQIRVAVAGGGTLRGRVARATPADEGPDAVVTAIEEAARASLALAGLTSMPASVGIAAPGPLHGAKGVVFSPPNLKGWRNVPLTRELETRFGCPVFLIKDANAAAVAEHGMGAGRGADTLVYITVSTGIGGGLILGGRLFEGPDGTAGEVGHVTVDRHGPVCNCGNRGCLEAVASGTAIARLAAAGQAAGKLRLPPGSAVSAETVYAAAAQGNPGARALTEEVGFALGLACVGLVHLFNPERIILGGGLIHAGPLLLDPVRAVLERHAMPIPQSRVRLVTADLGEDVGLWGAALHAQAQVQGG
ncbi:MAG TPA: ROK family protein [Chloroflexota bacterium]|nr:ROK family protein [Chloroflexota bacterium]